jgi:tripeptidyl-peptidase-1
LALTYPTSVIFYQGISQSFAPLRGTNDRYIGWLNFVLNQENVPQTISMAYGSTPEPSIPEEYAEAVCDLFLDSSVFVELASSSRVATTASAKGTAGTRE